MRRQKKSKPYRLCDTTTDETTQALATTTAPPKKRKKCLNTDQNTDQTETTSVKTQHVYLFLEPSMKSNSRQNSRFGGYGKFPLKEAWSTYQYKYFMHCSWLNARNLGCKEAGFDDKNLTLRFGVRLFDEEVLDREIQSGLKNNTGWFCKNVTKRAQNG